MEKVSNLSLSSAWRFGGLSAVGHRHVSSRPSGHDC